MQCIGPMEPFQTPVRHGHHARAAEHQCFRQSPKCRPLKHLCFCGFEPAITLKPAVSLLRRGFNSDMIYLSGQSCPRHIKGDFMPRKSKSKQPVQGTETGATTAVLEAQPETSVEPQADTTAEPEPMTVADPAPPEQTPTFVERISERSGRPAMPDPFLIALDNAAGIHLFENRQRRVMAIKFDEKPNQPVIDMIKEAGFGWNPKDRVWTKPVRGDSAVSTRIDAERLYQEIR